MWRRLGHTSALQAVRPTSCEGLANKLEPRMYSRHVTIYRLDSLATLSVGQSCKQVALHDLHRTWVASNRAIIQIIQWSRVSRWHIRTLGGTYTVLSAFGQARLDHTRSVCFCTQTWLTMCWISLSVCSARRVESGFEGHHWWCWLDMVKSKKSNTWVRPTAASKPFQLTICPCVLQNNEPKAPTQQYLMDALSGVPRAVPNIQITTLEGLDVIKALDHDKRRPCRGLLFAPCLLHDPILVSCRVSAC